MLFRSAAGQVLICTFHALGVRMLRANGEALGLKPQFSILDSDDVTSILKDAGGTTDAATARQWQWAISLWKNMGLNAQQAEAQASDDLERTTARIMARYGVTPVIAERPVSTDAAIEQAVLAAKSAGLCGDGDNLVVSLSRTSPRSDTDTIYVYRA